MSFLIDPRDQAKRRNAARLIVSLLGILDLDGLVFKMLANRHGLHKILQPDTFRADSVREEKSA